MIRILLISLSFAILPSTFAFAQIKNQNKIGIGIWDVDKLGTSLNLVETLKFTWYYTWKEPRLFSPSSFSNRTAEFVPMIWDEQFINSPIDGKSGALLGFNEPNLQKNLY